MTIKQALLVNILLSMCVFPTSFADDGGHAGSQMKHHDMIGGADDGRISLGLSPQMKAHQLANMRSHVEAIRAIIGLIGSGDFSSASETAHSKLGLTEEMKTMCNMFDNADFTALGLKFHESADVLGETLKTEDVNSSLTALNTTMGYCVQCHATFRQ